MAADGPRNLVYFAIARKRQYVHMMALVARYLERHPSWHAVVLLDESLHRWWHRSRLRWNGFEPFQLQGRSANEMFGRMRIFEYSRVEAYDKILYLDCDILVNLDLRRIFEIDFDPTDLCVVPEDYQPTSIHFALEGQPYTEDEIEVMSAAGIKGFNSGSLLFHRTAHMRDQFEEISAGAEEYVAAGRGEHAGDQGFLNYHFNRQGAVDYSLAPFVRLFPEEGEAYPNKLIHFNLKALGPGHVKAKLPIMRRYAARFLQPQPWYRRVRGARRAHEV